MDSHDLVIIGAGVAGLAASIYAMERKLNCIILESNMVGGQLMSLYPDKAIYDYPSYASILAKDLAKNMTVHARSQGANIHTGISVDGMSKRDMSFILTAGQTLYSTRAVLLATGMGHYVPRKLGVGGEKALEHSGIFYQHVPDKVTGKRVVVVGGGDTALETAVAAAQKGATVTIVHRSQTFRGAEKTADMVKKLEIPVEFLSEVSAIKGSERVQTVEIINKNGGKKTLSADYLAICIGVEMSNSFISKNKLLTDRGALMVNPDMRTSTEGIFACGDLVVPLGKYRRISVAIGTAATAINGIYMYLKQPYWNSGS